MKRKTTKEILADSFRELAETRPVDKITIREIVDNCDYSPATFYRHFKDKYDLIAWDYVHRTTVIMDKIGKDEYEWKSRYCLLTVSQKPIGRTEAFLFCFTHDFKEIPCKYRAIGPLETFRFHYPHDSYEIVGIIIKNLLRSQKSRI